MPSECLTRDVYKDWTRDNDTAVGRANEIGFYTSQNLCRDRDKHDIDPYGQKKLI